MNVSLTFAEVSRAHQETIQNILTSFEQQLHPSSTEDSELVTRALFSVRNQAVKMHNYTAFNQVLTCQIQDVRIAEVAIHFPRKQISCSCPQKKLCRHQLAVIFKLAQYFISLQDWANEWRSKKNLTLKSLTTERSPENWQRMVDEVLNYTFKDKRPIEGFLIASLLDNSRLKLQRQRPFEREWQDLFDLFIEVAMLKRLYEHSIQTRMQLEGNYFSYYLDHTFQRMWKAMDEVKSAPRLFAAEPFIDALQVNVRAIALMEKGSPQQRLTFYINFWMNLFHEKKRVESELQLLDEIGTLQSDIDLTTIKLVHYILLNAKPSVEQATEEIGLNNLEAFIEIAQFAMRHGYTDHAELILKKALPFLQQFIQDHLSPVRRQKFTRALNTVYAQLDLTEADELTLYAAFGKYGIDSFSDYLLKNGRYQHWVALHQLHPSSISYLDQCGLKEVVAHAPETTLPLYHYYATGEIQQKSRQNYKQAVRIWRAMKSASKKAGKLDYFETYMEAVQQQYKRLRALQEEINKSNLLL